MAYTLDVTQANFQSGPVNGIGREFKIINIDGVAAGTADLARELNSLSAVCTIEAVGAFDNSTDTEVNVIISGMDFSAGSGADGYADSYAVNTITWLEYLNTLSQTSATITEVAF